MTQANTTEPTRLSLADAMRPIKLIIQIPCYNEAGTLQVALDALPKTVPGIDVVEVMIIDDGSDDETVQVARQWGVDHIARLPRNQGLARAFMAGLDACLKAGADVIVNTDADNQYNADDVPLLVQPIIDGKAELVVGERPIDDIEHFSFIKKRLQRLGSLVVRAASNTDIPDATSGFRAMSRDAAMRLNVFSEYTYTLETIIQAGQKDMGITSVPIRTNGDLRPSRLVKSIRSYVQRSVGTIFRIFMTYRPMRFFLIAGSAPMVLGMLLIARWLYLVQIIDPMRSRAPSLIAAGICISLGLHLWSLGLIADLMSTNRSLLEDIQLRIRRADISSSSNAPSLPLTGVAGARHDRRDAA